MKNYSTFLATSLSFILSLIAGQSAVAQNYDGIWQSLGYGHILQISGNTADLYQVTQISNIYDETLTINNNNALGSGADLVGYLAMQSEQLKLTLTGGTTVLFNAIAELPEITNETDDPQVNFDVFWQTYQDWCALFPILEVNWQEQYQTYDALIDESTSDDDLFNYMAQMLATLNDGHSYLDDDDDRYFEGGPAVGLLWDDYDYDMMDMIEEQYIDGDYVFSNSEQISYGTIHDSIGYLAVNSMDEYDEDGNELDDNAAFASEIDAAMTYLQNTKALIIDVRFNFGGFDSNSRNLASRLINDSLLVYSKQVRSGNYDEFTPPTSFTIHPNELAYLDRPIVVLTSNATLSAADIFAIMAKEIDCVTLIGETTYGILSDNYTKYLPNAWEFGVSPERYLTNAGIDYEQQGIPPDIEVIGSVADFFNDKDNILETALDEIFESCIPTTSMQLNVFDDLKVFPNPVNSFLNIQLQLDKKTDVRMTINDTLGQLVLTLDKKGFSGENNFQINIEKLESGFYILNMMLDNQSLNYQFSVVKS